MLVANVRNHKGDRVPHSEKAKSDKGRIVTKLGLNFEIKLQQCMLMENEMKRFYLSIDSIATVDNSTWNAQ